MVSNPPTSDHFSDRCYSYLQVFVKYKPVTNAGGFGSFPLGFDKSFRYLLSAISPAEKSLTKYFIRRVDEDAESVRVVT